MRSVPRNIYCKGEHLSRCDTCGVPYLRSALRRCADGLLRCANDRPGRNEMDLAQATTRQMALVAARSGRGLPADGAVPDVDSDGNNSSASQYTGPVRRTTAADVYFDSGEPTGF
jgi:hypothetical protein